MKHYATSDFWDCYEDLPSEIQDRADEAFEKLKLDPSHPSLHLKKVDRFWSVRVSLHYRALAVKKDNDLVWFWIGTHSDYDKLIN